VLPQGPKGSCKNAHSQDMDVSENGVCPQNCIFYANMMINEWILGVPCFQTKPHALQKLRLKGHAKDIKGFF
jgi:hypothetical protein